jgi:hypothetical protein
MLISCPVIGIWQPKGRPVLAPLEELSELGNKGLLPSKQLNEAFGIVRNGKAVVPSVTLDIVIGENVESLFGGYLDEGVVSELRLEELAFVVPNILVKGRPVCEV